MISRTKNIVVSNGWSDDNKGDSAIVEGLLEVLSERVDGHSFSMISSFSEDSTHFRDSTRHLRNKFQLKVLSHPVWHRCPFKKTNRTVRLLDLLKAVSLLISPSIGAFFLTDVQKESVRVLKRADLVIAKGGHYLFGSSSIGGLFTLFSNAYTLLLAHRLGVKTALSANSIGPFVGGPARYLASYVFRRLDVIQLREMKSVNLLETLGVRSSIETFDTAFVVEAQDVDFSLPENYVVITSRQWDFPYDASNAKKKFDVYVEAIVEAAVYCSNEGISIVVAPQVIGPTKLEDDRVINKILQEKLMARGVNAILLDGDYSPGQLKSIYGKARFLIGTRFHSAILSLSAYTPVIVFSYHGPKAPGIMEQFGLQRYIFDIDSADPVALVDACKSLLLSEKELRKKISEKMGSVRRGIKDDVFELLEANG